MRFPSEARECDLRVRLAECFMIWSLWRTGSHNSYHYVRPLSFSTVHSLETGTLTFWCLSHIVVDILKTTVHPALCDPCVYSLPHLRPEKVQEQIQPCFAKLGQVCHGKIYGGADPKPRFLRFKVVFLSLIQPKSDFQKPAGQFAMNGLWLLLFLKLKGTRHYDFTIT